MKLYLDVSCLNRPFDDQRQPRIRLEAEAILWILKRIDTGAWAHVSSEMAVFEINAIRDQERRNRVLAMLPASPGIIALDEPILQRAEELTQMGFSPKDAVHVAAAAAQQADALITCDDQLLRIAQRHANRLEVVSCDPVTWMQKYEKDRPNT